MKNILYNISMFTLFLTGAIVFLVAYWLLYPYKTIEVNTNVLPTNKLEYMAGESLIYHLDYCKYIDRPVHIRRSFIDGVAYSMPDVTANNPMGCNAIYISVEIPNIPTGDYRIKVSYIYEVNKLREIETIVYTNAFKIVERK
jgi:hypothetical protein